MIKQYLTLLLHFSTGKQIFYVGESIILQDPMNKGFCHCADFIDSDGNMRCFMQPLSSCNVKISVLSSCDVRISVVFQCIILGPVLYMNTHHICFLTTCTLALRPGGGTFQNSKSCCITDSICELNGMMI